jgi:hypothetical protein
VHLYRGSNVRRATESDIRQEFGSGKRQVKVHFAADVLCQMGDGEC